MECPLLRLIKLVLNGFVDEEMVGLIVSLDASWGTGTIPMGRVFAGMNMMMAIMRRRAFMAKRASFKTTAVNLAEVPWFTTSEKTKSNTKSTF
jgi:hypothetical protein